MYYFRVPKWLISNLWYLKTKTKTNKNSCCYALQFWLGYGLNEYWESHLMPQYFDILIHKKKFLDLINFKTPHTLFICPLFTLHIKNICIDIFPSIKLFKLTYFLTHNHKGSHNRNLKSFLTYFSPPFQIISPAIDT